CCRGRRRGGRRCGGLLLDHDALARALAGTGVRVSALATHGQALAVTDATIGADVHQPFHVHRDLATEVTFHLDLALEDLAHAAGLVLGPRLHALVVVDARLREHPHRRRAADPVDIGERHLAALLPGKVDACDSCHGLSPALSLAAACGADS